MQRQKHSQLTAAAEEEDISLSPSLDRKIDQITEGISQYFNKRLRTLSTDNIKTIIDYISAINTEIRLSTNYRKDIIHLLTTFVKFHANSVGKHNFNFKDITRVLKN